ncbi:MAG: glycoside hydrolase family 2 TIM barrel-domain containing protein [Candidatus Bathyarchaeia archaeon]
MKKEEAQHVPSGVVFPRIKISLNGFWDFKVDPNDIGESQKWYIRTNFIEPKKIEVPFCWQSQFPDLRDYHGFAWYQRIFNISDKYSDCRVVLHIGAVNYDPKIWINDDLVGEFKGGYYPLEVDISKFVKFGEDNILTIKVFHPDSTLISQYPHGKQTWYSFVGGIWQSTFIEITSGIYLSNIFVMPDIKNSKIKVNVTVNNLPKTPEGFSINLKVISPEGEELEEEFIINQNEMSMEIILPKVLLWTLNNPQLYNITATLKKDGEPIDEITVTTGLREIEAKNGKIYLNGEPIYLRGVLNQDFYPKTIYTPPSDDFIRKEIELAKQMGINLIRIHIKLADPKYLDWADRLGILIWEEIPNVGTFTLSAEERLTETFRQMILRDRNHPSIIIWGIANEAWGVDPSSSRGRDWLIKMYNLAKTLDPTRLVVDNSPCVPNYHIITDIADYHWYNTIPGSYEQWVDFVKRFASDPSWIFGNNPIRRGDEPLIVSEFGVWGLPSLKKIREGYAKEGYSGDPWWFSKGWGSGVPKDVEKRFNEWNLNEVWRNWEEFAIASQQHQFQALKFMIEEIRKYPQINGYIITEFYDLHWECNGLLDFYRNPKAYMSDLPIINNDDLLIIDRVNAKINLWSGENFIAPVYFSKWSSGELVNAKLRWRIENVLENEIGGITLHPFTTSFLCNISFIAPNMINTTRLTLVVDLFDSDSNLVASNSIDILVSPNNLRYPKISKDTLILFYSPDKILSSIVNELRNMGYNVVITDTINKEASCVISSTYNDEIEGYIKSGGKAFIIVNSPRTLNVEGKRYNVGRRGGEWITDFHYIKNKKIFGNLPLENPLGWAYYLTMPDLVIKNISPTESKDVIAGYFEGWIHEHSATILKKEIGNGRLIISTFNFSSYGEDPVTTILFNNILEQLAE